MSQDLVDLHRIIRKERTRNIGSLLLVVGCLGVICLYVAFLTSPFPVSIFSDFLVNISAGFFSAAFIFIIVDRHFLAREKENDRQNTLLWGFHNYKTALEQAEMLDAAVVRLITRCNGLYSRSKGKKPEAKLAYLQQVSLLSNEANNKNIISREYLDMAHNSIRRLWNEYYLELKASEPDIAQLIQTHLDLVMRLSDNRKKRDEAIKVFVENTPIRIEKTEREMGAKDS